MPILDTARLYLRPYRDDDFAALHAILSDPVTMAHYPAPLGEVETCRWMERNQSRYRRDGFGLWAVCLKATDELIGDCGLVRQTIDGWDEVEIGYHIRRDLWGQGYATEAAAGCKRYGFHSLGLAKLICIIYAANTSSIRVAEKIGFTLEKEAYIFNRNHYIYSGYREEHKI